MPLCSLCGVNPFCGHQALPPPQAAGVSAAGGGAGGGGPLTVFAAADLQKQLARLRTEMEHQQEEVPPLGSLSPEHPIQCLLQGHRPRPLGLSELRRKEGENVPISVQYLDS